MITGTHAIIYAKDAGKARRFFRDVLRLRSVDAGQGWLIFALPPAEMGIHPAEKSGAHELYFTCDDVKATRKALEAKGVRFTQPIVDRGWGILTSMEIPGGGEVALYEPRHPTAIRPAAKRAKPAAKPKAKRSPARKTR